MFLAKHRQITPNKLMSHDDFLALCTENFAAALNYNKLWRGNLIPLRPIRKNIFCLTDTVYDIDRLENDLTNLQQKPRQVGNLKQKVNIIDFLLVILTIKV